MWKSAGRTPLVDPAIATPTARHVQASPGCRPDGNSASQTRCQSRLAARNYFPFFMTPQSEPCNRPLLKVSKASGTWLPNGSFGDTLILLKQCCCFRGIGCAGRGFLWPRLEISVKYNSDHEIRRHQRTRNGCKALPGTLKHAGGGDRSHTCSAVRCKQVTWHLFTIYYG